MPELPEVETVRRVLDRRLSGTVIRGYALGRPTFYRVPKTSRLRPLVGASVRAFRRRGKYLLLDTTRGTLTLHLGMSGRLSLGPEAKHVRFELRAGEHVLRFNDPRRFGRVGCDLPDLGPEPLSEGFSARTLERAFRGRRAPVKALLLDQSVVAGLGNIYATEALFRAGIRPDRAAGSLPPRRLERLARAVRATLSEAVALRGSTLGDEAFLDPLGRPGRAQSVLRVYGRERGACGHALKATRRPLAGRTSLYCPECQS